LDVIVLGRENIAALRFAAHVAQRPDVKRTA
jgi:hypothetical protein